MYLPLFCLDHCDRWEKIQRRLETVQKRRDERIAELQRRSQEAKEKADRVENAAELAAANIAEAVEKHLMVSTSRDYEESQLSPSY